MHCLRVDIYRGKDCRTTDQNTIPQAQLNSTWLNLNLNCQKTRRESRTSCIKSSSACII